MRFSAGSLLFCQPLRIPNRYTLFKHVQPLFRIKEAIRERGNPLKARRHPTRPECVSTVLEARKARLARCGASNMPVTGRQGGRRYSGTGVSRSQRTFCFFRPILFFSRVPNGSACPRVCRPPPAGAGTGGKDAPRVWSRARPASLRRVSPARDHLSYAPSLTATRPSLCGRRIPIFEGWRRHAAAR